MNGNNFLLELSGSSKPNCQQRHVSLNRGIGKNLLKQYSKKSSLFSIYKNTSKFRLERRTEHDFQFSVLEKFREKRDFLKGSHFFQ